MKLERATNLTEQTTIKCNSIKYDVEVAEEYIARQVRAVVQNVSQCCNVFLLPHCPVLAGMGEHLTLPPAPPSSHLTVLGGWTRAVTWGWSDSYSCVSSNYQLHMASVYYLLLLLLWLGVYPREQKSPVYGGGHYILRLSAL